MSINTKQTNREDNYLVIRKKINGLTYGDHDVPEWAAREIEKGMGLPVSNSVLVVEQRVLSEPKVLEASSRELTTEIPDSEENITTISPESTPTNWDEYYPENREKAKKLGLIQEHPWLLNGKITDAVLENLKFVQRNHDHTTYSDCLYDHRYKPYDKKYEALTSIVDDIYSLLNMSPADKNTGYKIIVKALENNEEILEIFLESPLLRFFTGMLPGCILHIGVQDIGEYFYGIN